MTSALECKMPRMAQSQPVKKWFSSASHVEGWNWTSLLVLLAKFCHASSLEQAAASTGEGQLADWLAGDILHTESFPTHGWRAVLQALQYLPKRNRGTVPWHRLYNLYFLFTVYVKAPPHLACEADWSQLPSEVCTLGKMEWVRGEIGQLAFAWSTNAAL